MRTINPKNIATAGLHGLMLGVVAPRPIAFASTVDRAGNINLSPYSFFNAFGSNPPTLIFSPCRRVRDNTTKHTLENVLEHKEVVINIVNFAIVEQMSLSSTEYDKGVNEFEKSGLTAVASQMVKPPRVAESPAAFECQVKEVISLGNEGGAGNLVVCEIVLAHFKEELFDEQGKIDPFKLDAVARMGGDWYCRANGEALFELEKPLKNKGIGVDKIPAFIRDSHVLTGNNLGRLGNVEALPVRKEVQDFARMPDVAEALTGFEENPRQGRQRLHKLAQLYLQTGDIHAAWKVLLQETL